MPPKGVDNVEAIIKACHTTIEALNTEEQSAWKAWLNSAIEVLDEMKGKFFLKTNPSIPVTNKCRKDTEELQAIATSGDFEGFEPVFKRFQENMDTLLKRSSMDGVIIT
jgi:hypothetical protein